MALGLLHLHRTQILGALRYAQQTSMVKMAAAANSHGAAELYSTCRLSDGCPYGLNSLGRLTATHSLILYNIPSASLHALDVTYYASFQHSIIQRAKNICSRQMELVGVGAVLELVCIDHRDKDTSYGFADCDSKPQNQACISIDALEYAQSLIHWL